jgi:hypothetical protein
MMTDMFYKWLGRVVWGFAVTYARQKYGRRIRGGLALAVLGIGVAGYLAASRNGD